MKRIYLDSCILIYLIEKHPDYSPKIQEVLENLPEYRLNTSASDLAVNILCYNSKDAG